MTDPAHSTLIVTRGPRLSETELLRLVAELAPRSVESLHRPLRIIVPSASLRQHVVARLVESTGRSMAGVVVQTLHQAARSVMERAGAHDRPAEELTSILVRRRAAADPVLGPTLERLDDGFGVVEAAVRDLLDAGFEPGHVDAVADKLAELEGVVTRSRLSRVAGALTVAAAVSLELDAHGFCRLEQYPQRAAGLLREGGPGLLPSRWVIIHGFADATGVATDFIQAVLAVTGGTVILDRPPDPVAADRDDAGGVFLDRLVSHLGGLTHAETEGVVDSPKITAFRAPTGESEAREVARRVRALLDSGVRADRIGIVARELEWEAAAYRRHLRRLGVPFSGPEATLPGGAAWRRARLLSEILRLGEACPAELWLEALGDLAGGAELGLALRTLGVSRLAEAANLSGSLDPNGSVVLPMPDGAEGESRRGRVLPSQDVAALARRAADLIGLLENWPEVAPPGEHGAMLQRVVALLGWSGSDSGDEVAAALAAMEGGLPEDLKLGRSEVVDAARRVLAEVGLEPVGGSGGGVHLVSAMDARARTFDHLFLVAMNRGRFPRVVQEDALLPDTVRGHLAVEVLPEFPVKARGLDEERYLFAQLAASTPHLTLSWRETEDGTRAAPSPFVERLRRELGLDADHCRSFPEVEEGGALGALPAFEHAVLAAGGGRGDLAPVLAAAFHEGTGRAAVETADPVEWARARVDVIEAIEPSSSVQTPGPWAGLVGPGALSRARTVPPVTGLELTARCPWQAFAQRRLGVAAMPDPRLGLPETRGLLLGSVVHEVLQRVVEREVGATDATISELAEAAGMDVRWPEPAGLLAMTVAAAEAVAGRNGLAAAGIAPLLAAQAAPLLEVARRLHWPDGVLSGVVASEVGGEATVSSGVAVRFRADRVDRRGDGLVLVDYKSGKPVSVAKKPDTRRRHLLGDVARGVGLQAVAYALGVSPPRAAVGMYVSLKPNIGNASDDVRTAAVTADDGDMVAAFEASVDAIVEAWMSGGLVPRVEEAGKPGKKPAACDVCSVAQACLRSDPGFVGRLVRWLEGVDDRSGPAEVAASRMWWLGVDRPEDSE